MGGAVGPRSGPISDINVTPLIDVVLVLLVVFMVITPLLSSGLPVDLPMATQTVTVNDVGQHIVISVTKDGLWAVDQDKLEDQEEAPLIEAINAAYRENSDRSILVKADRRLEYGEVRKLLDILAERNFTSVYIAAGKEK
jgi:biopolymer transport protein ExbD